MSKLVLMCTQDAYTTRMDANKSVKPGILICDMRQPLPVSRLTAILVLCFVTLSCASSSVELNSERIARKYGSYGVEVIENTDNLRVSNLYSMEASRPICRTFAVVGISREIDSSFAVEHAQILEGASIGAVFKRNGWNIEKRIKDARIARVFDSFFELRQNALRRR